MPILGTVASSYLQSTTSFESIASVTLTASSATITFSSIPSTYKHLHLRINARFAGSGISNAGSLTINGDGTASNYASHYLSGAPHVSTTFIEVNQQVGTLAYWNNAPHASNGGNQANYFSGTIIEIYDYTNTNKFKVGKGLTGFSSNAGSETSIRSWSGLYRSTSAITSLSFSGPENYAANSVFSLYGIKG